MSRQIRTAFYSFPKCFHIIIWEKFWTCCKRKRFTSILIRALSSVASLFPNSQDYSESLPSARLLYPGVGQAQSFFAVKLEHILVTCACCFVASISALLTFAPFLSGRHSNSAELHKDGSGMQFPIP